MSQFTDYYCVLFVLLLVIINYEIDSYDKNTSFRFFMKDWLNCFTWNNFIIFI